jgi:hypothetical protein
VSVFDQFKRSFNELLDRATKPEDRREAVARMKDTLVMARVGLDELKDALSRTQRKLELERKELATIRRRKELAVGISDAETVALAERYEKQHEQLVSVLEEKVAVQSREVAIAESEVDEMKAEIRKAMIGGPTTSGAFGTAARGAAAAGDATGSAGDDDPLGEREGERVREEIDSLARERAREARDDEANRRLDELKKRMGK